MKILDVAQLNGEVIADGDNYAIIKALSNRSFPESNLNDILKEIDIDLHEVMDPSIRKDKPVYRKAAAAKRNEAYPTNARFSMAEPEAEKVLERMEKINRVNLSMQKLICDKRVSFCLANPVIRTYSGLGTDEEHEQVRFPMERIYFDNKIPTHDRETARNIFTYTEVAEYWYPVELKERSMKYGFDSNKKLRVSMFSRENGYKFFPLKDRNGDLICFSMEWQEKLLGKLTTFFWSFTDEEIVKFKRVGAWKWEVVESDPHDLGKIPIVFGWQMYPEYRPATSAIKRLEKILSNHGEINDYHSAPKLFLKNADKIDGVGEKGQAGIVLQGKGEADAKYITWDHATDSVKLEIDNLLMIIYSLTQTPNISFDNIKGIGPISGVATKLLFLDAHLAVKDKEGVLLDFQQRRNSIVTSYLGIMEPALKPLVDKVEINSKLNPFMIADDKEKAEIAQIENGNLPVKSQETTVIEAGGNKEEYEKIKAETAARSLNSITEPTEL